MKSRQQTELEAACCVITLERVALEEDRIAAAYEETKREFDEALRGLPYDVRKAVLQEMGQYLDNNGGQPIDNIGEMARILVMTHGSKPS